MKYSVTLTLRDISVPLDNFGYRVSSYYYEASSVHDLNDWLFHHICNSNCSSEIIGLFMEVFDD